jgi:hypothetical protein
MSSDVVFLALAAVAAGSKFNQMTLCKFSDVCRTLNSAILCGVFLCQLVTADSSQSDTQSQNADPNRAGITDVTKERVGGIGNSRPPSFQLVILTFLTF